MPNLEFSKSKKEIDIGIDHIVERVTKINLSDAEIVVYNDRNGVSHWHFYLYSAEGVGSDILGRAKTTHCNDRQTH